MIINDVFETITGDGKYTEAYLVNHRGEIPVLSGKTNNNGVFGYVDEYDHDLPQCLSYSKDGEHSGTLFLQQGKLCLTSHVNILKLRDKYSKKVDLLWFKYKYEPIFKSLVRGKFGIPSLPSDIVKNMVITIPGSDVQNEELTRFIKREEVICILRSLIKEVDERITKLQQIVFKEKSGTIVSGEMLLEPLPKNSGLTEKFLYDYSDPTFNEQLPVFNGANTPSGFLPSYSLKNIEKDIIVYQKNDAILIVRKGVKAGTLFIPRENKYIVGEDIVIVKFRDEYKNKIDSHWFVREFNKSFRLNTTGEEGSATFSVMKMNKMQFSIPSLPTQKKQVEKYAKLDKTVDELLVLREFLIKKITSISNITLV